MFYVAILILLFAHSADALGQDAASSAPAQTQPTTTRPLATVQELDEFLLLVTGNNTPEARELGARSLLRNGSDEATRRLIGVLKGPNDALAKQAICRALLSVDVAPPALLDSLLELLGSDPPELAQMIAPLLRRFDAGGVIERLSNVAADPNIAIGRRRAAIFTLRSLGDEIATVRVIMQLLADPAEPVRTAAMEALSDVAGQRFDTVAAAEAWWSKQQDLAPLEWLRQVNQRRKDEILRVRTERESMVQRLVAANREVYRLTPETAQPQKLLEFLRDDSASVRTLGLDLVNGLITDRKEISEELRQQVLKLIGDVTPLIRRRAASLSGDLRPATATERLIDALALEPDPAVRAAMVNALGRLDDVRAIPEIMQRLNDPSKQVVAEAAIALGQLGRRTSNDTAVAGEIAGALIRRFGEISPQDDELCLAFIEAMGRIGDSRFESVFSAEIAGRRSVRIQAAAITALAAFPNSSGQIRTAITAQDPEIRLAAVQALGRCGRSREDLGALSTCLDSAQEPSQPVRERAWESYLTLLRNLPVREQIEQADRFDRPDPAAQRRRADIIVQIQNGRGTTETLSQQQRLALMLKHASALRVLKEHAEEARILGEALVIAETLPSDNIDEIRQRRLEALLRSGQESAALARFGKYAAEATSVGASAILDQLADIIVSEIEGRLQSAAQPDAFQKLFELIQLTEVEFRTHTPSRIARITAIRTAAKEARLAAINKLLDGGNGDPAADGTLVAFGRDLVLPQIASRLTNEENGRLAPAAEGRLVGIARRLAPEWSGFAADADEAARRNAMQALTQLAAGTATTSAPVSQ